jgi:hypothetical protein
MSRLNPRNPFILSEAEDANDDDYKSEGEVDEATLAELEEDFEEDLDDEIGESDVEERSEKGKKFLTTVNRICSSTYKFTTPFSTRARGKKINYVAPDTLTHVRAYRERHCHTYLLTYSFTASPEKING